MKQSTAWITQLASDFKTGDLLFNSKDPVLYCQAVAKYQQVVEKAVKAMMAAIVELGISVKAVTKSHDPSKEIEVLFDLMKKENIDRASIVSLKKCFDDRSRDKIHNLCKLAPHWPNDNVSFRRNTEYPFRLSSGDWTAPAVSGIFAEKDVLNAQALAKELRRKADEFVTGVSLAKK